MVEPGFCRACLFCLLRLHRLRFLDKRTKTLTITMSTNDETAIPGVIQPGIFEDLQRKIDEDTAVKDVCSQEKSYRRSSVAGFRGLTV